MVLFSRKLKQLSADDTLSVRAPVLEELPQFSERNVEVPAANPKPSFRLINGIKYLFLYKNYL